MKNSIGESKAAITRLVRIMKDRVKKGEAKKIEIALVVFGILQQVDQLAPYYRQSLKKSELIYKGPKDNAYTHLAYTEFFPVPTRTESITNALNEPFIEPTSNTPLYNAISLGCELLKDRDGEKHLVILSDGGNFTNQEIPRSPEDREIDFKLQNGTPFQLSDVKDSFQNTPLTLCFYQVLKGEYKVAWDLFNKDPKKKADDKDATELGAAAAVEFFNWMKRLQDQPASAVNKFKIMTAENFQDFEEVGTRLEDDFALPKIQIERSTPGQEKIVRDFGEPIRGLSPGPINLSVVKDSSKGSLPEPLRMELYPGQHAQVAFDQKSLMFRTPKDLSEDKQRRPLIPKGQTKYTLNWSFEPHADERGRFTLELDLRQSPPTRYPNDYLRWPRFAVAKMKQKQKFDDERTNTIVFTDLGFEDRHYPTLRFGVRNLREDGEQLSKQSLDVWMSFSDIHALFAGRENMRMKIPNGTEKLSFQSYQVDRRGRVLQVKRTGAQDGNCSWVLCPNAKRVTRKYTVSPDAPNVWTETHRFDLEEADDIPVPLYIFSEQDLEALSRQDVTPEEERLFWYSDE
jgi:hypothetical protein